MTTATEAPTRRLPVLRVGTTARTTRTRGQDGYAGRGSYAGVVDGTTELPRAYVQPKGE